MGAIIAGPMLYDSYNGRAAKVLGITELVLAALAISMNIAAILMELESSYNSSFISSGIFVSRRCFIHVVKAMRQSCISNNW